MASVPLQGFSPGSVPPPALHRRSSTWRPPITNPTAGNAADPFASACTRAPNPACARNATHAFHLVPLHNRRPDLRRNHKPGPHLRLVPLRSQKCGLHPHPVLHHSSNSVLHHSNAPSLRRMKKIKARTNPLLQPQ